MDINCRICLSSEESVMLSVFDRVSDFNMCLSELILDISDVKVNKHNLNFLKKIVLIIIKYSRLMKLIHIQR